jgi:hypothetical protein
MNLTALYMTALLSLLAASYYVFPLPWTAAQLASRDCASSPEGDASELALGAA